MELYLIWLTLVFRNNYKNVHELLNFFNSPEEIYNISEKEWNNYDINKNTITRLINSEEKINAEKLYKKCLTENISLLPISSDKYPFNLKKLDYPPLLLYYKGELKTCDECSIAIVGARNHTLYGKTATEYFSRKLASANITIISGMARGIDTIAHTTALQNNGRTIAVLGCGVNIVYPSENKNLYNKIIDNGAIISEFPPDTKAYPYNFPIRNNIISGLSLGVLVIEASLKSGSIITARLAGEQGRNVFCVPGEIFNKTSTGTNELIKDGAKIVTTSDDILEEIHLDIKNTLNIAANFDIALNLSEQELKIFNLLSLNPASTEHILLHTNLKINELNSYLTTLELNDYITKLPGDLYIKNSKYIK